MTPTASEQRTLGTDAATPGRRVAWQAFAARAAVGIATAGLLLGAAASAVWLATSFVATL
jgi:hypothetical protein